MSQTHYSLVPLVCNLCMVNPSPSQVKYFSDGYFMCSHGITNLLLSPSSCFVFVDFPVLPFYNYFKFAFDLLACTCTYIVCLYFSYDSGSTSSKEEISAYKIPVCLADCLWSSFIYVQRGEKQSFKLVLIV